jgi:predicted regulator of Ras-like GTPase activity (Roadblock/LC7/MglB family)
MFNFLKKFLGRNEAATAVAQASVATGRAVGVARPVAKASAGVEVASLSLRVILEKMPADLKAIVNQLPDAEAKIVLPVSTILKQLASGSVKMSLASLVRQAPPGTFRKAEIEEKRMVDVPLSEVFKTVNPARLERRAGQRQYDVPDDATGLFGRHAQARSVTEGAAAAAPAPAAQPVPPAEPAKAVTPEPVSATEAPKPEEPKVEPMRVLRMPGIEAAPAPAAPAAEKKSEVAKPAPAAASARASLNGELSLSFVEVASAWPEGVRNELSILPGDTKLVIPASAVAPGLQAGKVTFPWSQVRVWIQPAFKNTVSIAEDFSLTFPLKVVAPAFVAATGASKRQEGTVVDQSMPDFFGPAAAKGATAEAPKPSAESAPTIPAAPVQVQAAAAPAASSMPAPGLKLSISDETDSQPLSAVPERKAQRSPGTLGELFGQPDRANWSPSELIARVCDLPGVAGAVVALEEGLVVAQKLPEGLAAETFAAFMPQFFGRMERYAQEMKLGNTNEITIHSDLGPCHLARTGKVFFAALGRAGEKLPAGLKLIPAELANQNQ